MWNTLYLGAGHTMGAKFMWSFRLIELKVRKACRVIVLSIVKDECLSKISLVGSVLRGSGEVFTF